MKYLLLLLTCCTASSYAAQAPAQRSIRFFFDIKDGGSLDLQCPANQKVWDFIDIVQKEHGIMVTKAMWRVPGQRQWIEYKKTDDDFASKWSNSDSIFKVEAVSLR